MKRFATQYNHDRAISALFATVNTEDSMTQQSDRDETDINIIVARYGITGQVPQVLDTAQYGDFSQVTDYRSALDQIRQADELFAEVPAKIREKFHNDPAKFLDFATNPENLDEMREMGLAAPKEPEFNNHPTPPRATELRYDDNNGTPPSPQNTQETPNGNANLGTSPVPPAQGAGGRPRTR